MYDCSYMDAYTSGNTPERRSVSRVQASFVEYCKVEDASQTKYQAFSENISTRGMCILVNEDFPVNTRLLITIYLMDASAPFELKSRVAWTRASSFLKIGDRQHYDVGIQFCDIPEEIRLRLENYVNSISRQNPPQK